MPGKTNSKDSSRSDGAQLLPYLRAGATSSYSGSCFSADSALLFVPVGSDVEVRSVQTGAVVSTLSFHTRAVTAITLHPSNSLQLIVSSADCHVTYWDYRDALFLKSEKYPWPLLGLWTVGELEKGIYLLTAAEDDQFVLRKSKGDTSSVVFELTSSETNRVAASQKAALLAVAESRTLRFYQSTTENKFKIKFPEELSKMNKDYFTCVTFHPSDDTVAAGTKFGRVLLLSGVCGESPLSSFIHWHSNPVKSLQYTTQGGYLLTGGAENTLVRWSLGLNRKEFLPRLGAAVAHITVSPDNSTYALSLDDNVTKMITDDWQVRHICTSLAGSAKKPAGLLYHLRSGAVITNARVGHLQLFNVHSNAAMYLLDVTGENLITPRDLSTPTYQSEVLRALCTDRLLVTMEMLLRRYSDEQRIRFWRYDDVTTRYSEEAVLQSPHHATITTAALHSTAEVISDGIPVDPLSILITGDKEGTFKCWSLSDLGKWECCLEEVYHGETCRASCISADGSLALISSGPHVVAISCDEMAVKRILHPQHEDISLMYLCETPHLALFCLSSTSICLVSLLTEAVLWTHELAGAAALAYNNVTNHLAVLHNDEISVFHPAVQGPVFNQSIGIHATSATFVPSKCEEPELPEWLRSADLLLLSSSDELYSLTTLHKVTQKRDALKARLSEVGTETKLSLLLKQTHGGKEESQGEWGPAVTTRQKTVSHLPSHLLPPVTLLCQEFLETLVLRNGVAASFPDEVDILADEYATSAQREIELDSDSDSVMATSNTAEEQLPSRDLEQQSSLTGPDLTWLLESRPSSKQVLDIWHSKTIAVSNNEPTSSVHIKKGKEQPVADMTPSASRKRLPGRTETIASSQATPSSPRRSRKVPERLEAISSSQSSQEPSSPRRSSRRFTTS